MFSWKKSDRKRLQTGRTVGLRVANDTLTIVACAAADGDGKPRIEAWDSVELNDSLPFSDALQRFVDQNDLRGQPCRVLLSSYDYSLRLVERPANVPDEELPEATRWLIRDLVEFDIDHAQMAVVLLPEDERRARTPRMFVVAAREDPLLETAQAVVSAGLDLAGFEILETSMIALAAQMPQTVAGHGVLWLDDKSSALTISLDHRLLLARRLATDTETLDDATQLAVQGPEGSEHQAQEILGPLLLEIQRSLDYYESEYGSAPVTRLTVLPSAIDSTLLVSLMTEPLRPLSVESFELERFFEIEELPPGSAQSDLLLAAGAAWASPDTLGASLVPHSFRQESSGFGLDSLIRFVAAVSFMMMLLYGWNAFQLKGERETLLALEAEQQSIQDRLDRRLEDDASRSTDVDPAEELEALGRVRDAGLRTLRDLSRGNTQSIVPFSDVMTALSRQDLESLWIERIELSDGGASIAIDGRVLDAADLPTFLRRLGREPSFESRLFKTLFFSRPEDESRGLRFRIATNANETEDTE